MYNMIMKDLLVTYVQGEKFFNNFDCEIFMNSLSKFKTFEKLCIVKDISDNSVNILKKYFDHVIFPDHSINFPNSDRFIAYYEWLVKHPNKYEYVFHVDFRDMIIQKDPFEYMKQFPEYDAFLTVEGMKISDCQCNSFWANNFNELLLSHQQDFTDHLVINTGTIGAKYSTFLNFCLLMFTNTNRISKNYTFDQAVFNYLYPYFIQNPTIKICHPYDSNFIVTGEGVKRGHVDIKFDGKKVFNLNDEQYYVVHQWDRLEFADKIRDNKRNAFSLF